MHQHQESKGKLPRKIVQVCCAEMIGRTCFFNFGIKEGTLGTELGNIAQKLFYLCKVSRSLSHVTQIPD